MILREKMKSKAKNDPFLCNGIGADTIFFNISFCAYTFKYNKYSTEKQNCKELDV